MLPLLEKQEDFSTDALFELLKGYVDEKGVKTGFVMWPIRTAVSGKQNTPVAQPRSWRFLKRRVTCAD